MAKQSKSTRGAVAVYVRVSTLELNEENQKREIRRWLKGQGIESANVRWFVDKATGANLERPAFEEMQSAIFNGEIGCVVVWKLDRLSRSLKDGIAVLSEWCERGLRVVSVTQQIDFNGTVGKMLAAVLLGVAEMERETMLERQRVGIERAKEEGKYQGRKPGTTKAKPARARALKAKGLTADEIATAMGISRRSVFNYLKD